MGRQVSVHQALAASARRALLDRLRDGGPADARTLADELALHVTTVRFHLDLLIQAQLVRSRPQPRGDSGGGRPRLLYAATDPPEVEPPGRYAVLVGLLAAQLGETAETRSARAEQAGTAWAAELVAAPAASRRPSTQAVARTVTALFDDLGFKPELTRTGDGHEIRLRGCPFRAAARSNPEVVCSVHLGLLHGALTRLGARSVTPSLRPLVEPELCVAHLTAGDRNTQMDRDG